MGSNEAYLGAMIFGEEPTEEMEEYRRTLEEEIETLELRKRDLFGDIRSPGVLKDLKEKIAGAEGKRAAVEEQIIILIANKQDELEKGIKDFSEKIQKRKETYIALAEKLRQETKKAHEELKEAKRDSMFFEHNWQNERACLINDIDNLRKQKAHTFKELEELEKEIDVKTEALDYRASSLNGFEKDLNGKRADLEAQKGEFKTRIEGALKKIGVEMVFIDKEKIRLDGLAKTLEQRTSSLEAQSSQNAELQESVAAQREEMRVWSKKLEEREAKVSQREEDLDKNWTLFMRESGKSGSQQLRS